MRSAADYLAHIRAFIILSDRVDHWSIVREESLNGAGLFRYRLALRDGTLLEMFERFAIVAEEVIVLKYSFHWQTDQNGLIKRWDNAPHHPEVASFPNHVHEGDESNVLPHPAVTAEVILGMLAGAKAHD